MKKVRIDKIKLTKQEQAVEQALIRGEYVPASQKIQDEIAVALERRRKNTVLNIRMNQGDLDCLKAKAKKLGLKYQTFISEILHRVAH